MTLSTSSPDHDESAVPVIIRPNTRTASANSNKGKDPNPGLRRPASRQQERKGSGKVEDVVEAYSGKLEEEDLEGLSAACVEAARAAAAVATDAASSAGACCCVGAYSVRVWVFVCYFAAGRGCWD